MALISDCFGSELFLFSSAHEAFAIDRKVPELVLTHRLVLKNFRSVQLILDYHLLFALSSFKLCFFVVTPHLTLD